MAVKAENDLRYFVNRVDEQLREMRAEQASLRDKVDKNFEKLTASVTELSKTVNKVSTKLNALMWVVSIVGTVILFFSTVGKNLGWFE